MEGEMGSAAYRRGTQAIRDQIDASSRPREFMMMDVLNAVPKNPDAGTPFKSEGGLRLSYSHKGWWIICMKTGFGFWYKTLIDLMKHWNVQITGYDNGEWIVE